MPAIVVEVVPQVSFRGLQLGGGQIVTRTVLFQIFAETPWERDKAFDIITSQNDKTIHGLNLATMTFPLNANGSLYSGALPYPVMAGDNNLWRKIRLKNTKGQPNYSLPPLYCANVVTSCEFDAHEL
jgi:hypothetical protein